MTGKRPRRGAPGSYGPHKAHDELLASAGFPSSGVCSSGKLVFETKADAKRYQRGIKRNANSVGKRVLHVYECPGCGKWHMTSRTA